MGEGAQLSTCVGNRPTTANMVTHHREYSDIPTTLSTGFKTREKAQMMILRALFKLTKTNKFTLMVSPRDITVQISVGHMWDTS